MLRLTWTLAPAGTLRPLRGGVKRVRWSGRPRNRRRRARGPRGRQDCGTGTPEERERLDEAFGRADARADAAPPPTEARRRLVAVFPHTLPELRRLDADRVRVFLPAGRRRPGGSRRPRLRRRGSNSTGGSSDPDGESEPGPSGSGLTPSLAFTGPRAALARAIARWEASGEAWEVPDAPFGLWRVRAAHCRRLERLGVFDEAAERRRLS